MVPDVQNLSYGIVHEPSDALTGDSDSDYDPISVKTDIHTRVEGTGDEPTSYFERQSLLPIDIALLNGVINTTDEPLVVSELPPVIFPAFDNQPEVAM
jgi:hypothetical protein